MKNANMFSTQDWDGMLMLMVLAFMTGVFRISAWLISEN